MICAAGILVKDDKILLGKRCSDRTFYPDCWDIIGGHCKNDETPEQTLSRELREEIGVTPTSFVQIAVLHDPEPRYQDYQYNIYVVTDWTGSPSNLALHEHSELKWFALHEAVTLNLAHPGYAELFKSLEKIGEE